jgi:hypothetical protein
MTKARSQPIEEGDIYFFYRPRVEAEEVRGREDIQRFFMVLAAERPKRTYRLFVVGRKKLPEPASGARHPEQRNWALNVLTTKEPEAIRRALLAQEYSTETRGERFVPGATPVGEGKYQLLRHKDHTELACALALPEEPGPAQEEFDIQKEASYVVAVKNPELAGRGLPAPKEPPAYPKRLREKFGERRWIDIDDPALLDYENAQLLLLGAHAGTLEEELGVALEVEEESLHSAEVCRELRLRCERERVRPLLTGEFPEKEEGPCKTSKRGEPRPVAKEVRRLSREESPTKAGKLGGRAAAKRAPSAAAITRLLGGIDLPKSRRAILAYARRHKERLENPEEALELLGQLPEEEYKTMAEITAKLGEIR